MQTSNTKIIGANNLEVDVLAYKLRQIITQAQSVLKHLNNATKQAVEEEEPIVLTAEEIEEEEFKKLVLSKRKIRYKNNGLNTTTIG